MGETTGIAWTHATFNPWIGCERVSEECTNCYADAGSRRLAAQHRLKLWDDGSTRYLTGEDYWKQPARWNRAAEKAGERRRVFCASFSDVGERRPELVAPRQRLQAVIRETPWLDWLLLSKRPESLVELFGALWPGEWPSNVWAGTTVGIRASLHRLDSLRDVPARIRFVSAEPLLEDLGVISLRGIDWVIIGSESGPRARPMEIGWARSLVERCVAESCSCFVKQIATPLGHRHADPKGGDPCFWPEGHWPREFPQ